MKTEAGRTTDSSFLRPETRLTLPTVEKQETSPPKVSKPSERACSRGLLAADYERARPLCFYVSTLFASGTNTRRSTTSEAHPKGTAQSAASTPSRSWRAASSPCTTDPAARKSPQRGLAWEGPCPATQATTDGKWGRNHKAWRSVRFRAVALIVGMPQKQILENINAYLQRQTHEGPDYKTRIADFVCTTAAVWGGEGGLVCLGCCVPPGPSAGAHTVNVPWTPFPRPCSSTRWPERCSPRPEMKQNTNVAQQQQGSLGLGWGFRVASMSVAAMS